MQVFCIVQIFIIHCLDFLCYPIPEMCGSDDFHIVTEGEYQGFKFLVHLNVDGDDSVVGGFFKDAL